MPKVTFISADNDEQVVEVRGGVSIQDAASQNGVIGIEADCGGACSCATCHIYIADEWVEKVGAAGELEASMLEMVPSTQPSSRLSCQVKMSAELDGLVVRTPKTQEGF